MNNLMGIDLVNILSWIVFGLLVGIVAHLIDPGQVKGGIVGTAITGVLGSLVGGFLAQLLFGYNITGFNISSFLIAIGGALILAFLQRMLFRNQSHIKTETGRLQ
jgi:uncharacterized membrane protein YeaQ/YmgE (transglycosylase-associated protein family)